MQPAFLLARCVQACMGDELVNLDQDAAADGPPPWELLGTPDEERFYAMSKLAVVQVQLSNLPSIRKLQCEFAQAKRTCSSLAYSGAGTGGACCSAGACCRCSAGCIRGAGPPESGKSPSNRTPCAGPSCKEQGVSKRREAEEEHAPFPLCPLRVLTLITGRRPEQKRRPRCRRRGSSPAGPALRSRGSANLRAPEGHQIRGKLR